MNRQARLHAWDEWQSFGEVTFCKAATRFVEQRGGFYIDQPVLVYVRDEQIRDEQGISPIYRIIVTPTLTFNTRPLREDGNE